MQNAYGGTGVSLRETRPESLVGVELGHAHIPTTRQCNSGTGGGQWTCGPQKLVN